MSPRRETDLYDPMKRFLESQGYEVKGEVKGCDMLAVRGDEVVAVELKAGFNLTLVLQAIQRQQMTDAVYVAVEAPKSKRSGPRLGELQGLCRRLGLGFAIIHFSGRKEPWVEVVCDPGPFTPHRLHKRRAALLGEFARRSADFNTGGSTRRALVTAYREEALRVAEFLRRHGSGSPKEIRAATGAAKTAAILYDDPYGWFERVAKGVYRLSAKGEAALTTYADVVAAALEGSEP